MPGVTVKKNYLSLYDRTQVSPSLNIINALCAGFQEPAAVSFFVGNLVSFKPKNIKTELKGKAYMGYLLSMGNYHIRDSELIADDWVELEWKIKGDRFSKNKKMKWSCRMGTKQHSDPDIRDVIYFSIKRDRIDFETNLKTKPIFRNTGIEYILDLNSTNGNILSNFLLVGKSFPANSKKYTFQIHFGFVLEEKGKYTGLLKRNIEKQFSVMIRPNIVF